LSFGRADLKNKTKEKGCEGAMNIASHQIQNVIRAYGHRLGRSRLIKYSGSTFPSSKDTISISTEAKRQIAEQIADQVVSIAKRGNLKGGLPNDGGENVGRALENDSQMLSADGEIKGFKFKILNADNKSEVKTLSVEDTRKLLAEAYYKIKGFSEEP